MKKRMVFAGVIELKILSWGDYLALSGCTLNAVSHKQHYKKEAGRDMTQAK